MIVVAIVGILAAVAIPKFANLMRKASEGSCKGNLGAIRSALSIYYGDMEGQYPGTPAALTIGGKYMTAMPAAKTPDYHAASASIYLQSQPMAGLPAEGGWFYYDVAGVTTWSTWGSIQVNCVHTDTKGSVWSSY